MRLSRDKEDLLCRLARSGAAKNCDGAIGDADPRCRCRRGLVSASSEYNHRHPGFDKGGCLSPPAGLGDGISPEEEDRGGRGGAGEESPDAALTGVGCARPQAVTSGGDGGEGGCTGASLGVLSGGRGQVGCEGAGVSGEGGVQPQRQRQQCRPRDQRQQRRAFHHDGCSDEGTATGTEDASDSNSGSGGGGSGSEEGCVSACDTRGAVTRQHQEDTGVDDSDSDNDNGNGCHSYAENSCLSPDTLRHSDRSSQRKQYQPRDSNAGRADSERQHPGLDEKAENRQENGDGELEIHGRQRRCRGGSDVDPLPSEDDEVLAPRGGPVPVPSQLTPRRDLAGDEGRIRPAGRSVAAAALLKCVPIRAGGSLTLRASRRVCAWLFACASGVEGYAVGSIPMPYDIARVFCDLLELWEGERRGVRRVGVNVAKAQHDANYLGEAARLRHDIIMFAVQLSPPVVWIGFVARTIVLLTRCAAAVGVDQTRSPQSAIFLARAPSTPFFECIVSCNPYPPRPFVALTAGHR